jgi:hypothetical protein
MFKLLSLEAEKVAQVSKIQWQQKITEKESQKKISEIEGIVAIYSLGTPLSSINKTDRRNITEILLTVVLNTITLTLRRFNF